MPHADEDHKASVLHWVQGNKPLVKSESFIFDRFMEDHDLIALAWKAKDRTSLEDLVERRIRSFPNLVQRVSVYAIDLFLGANC